MNASSGRHAAPDADVFPLPVLAEMEDLNEPPPAEGCAGKEAPKARAEEWFPSHKYFIAGTWANFSPLAMQWDGSNFVHCMTVGSKGWESFQILQGGDWDKTYYPSVKDASPLTKHTLKGPDKQGNGKNWTVGVPPDKTTSERNAAKSGDHYRIVVTVDEDSMVTKVDWAQLAPGDLKASVTKELGRPMLGPRRVLVLRHGSRPNGEIDPPLDLLGFRQAEQAAKHLGKEAQKLGVAPIKAIFCSPFLRAQQTAAPVAQALNLRICVEEGFCELLAHQWLHDEDPLPWLGPLREGLPPNTLFDREYKSAAKPPYPDCVGRMRKGDAEGRKKPTKRHRRAIEVALAAAKGGSVLVVAHGATHDFLAEALCPMEHIQANHTPHCVDHCGITEIQEEAPSVDGRAGSWHLLSFGACPWQKDLVQRLKKAAEMQAAEAEQRAKTEAEPDAPAPVAPVAKTWAERKAEEEARSRTAAMNAIREEQQQAQEEFDHDQPIWVVVGGETSRGILVRSGASLHSRELSRLETGARVVQIEVKRDRLHYRKLRGDGPDFGWVSIKHKDVELMRREDQPE